MNPRVLLLAAAVLTACSHKTEWKDTTGKGRSAAQTEADAVECRTKAGFGEIGSNTSYHDAIAKMSACMALHGWSLDTARNSNSTTPAPPTATFA